MHFNFSSLLQDLLDLIDDWRYGFGGGDRGNLFFGLALVSVFGVVMALVYFAYGQNRAVNAETLRMTELGCLARNIFHEARGEPLEGQQAVAEVTLNRVASGQFPNTVCEVVNEAHWDRRRGRRVAAFSWTELDEVARPSGTSWDRALEIATRVYDAEHEAVTGGALFYHATSIEPRWATSKKPITTIGRHIFYE